MNSILNRRYAVGGVILALGILMMLFGAYREEIEVVFTKAINICLECIGLG